MKQFEPIYLGDFTMSNKTGVTQCPKCGSVGTYPIRLQDGGQVICCVNCRKNFTAEVRQGVFTGRNR
jgi:hypothetical protein